MSLKNSDEIINEIQKLENSISKQKGHGKKKSSSDDKQSSSKKGSKKALKKSSKKALKKSSKKALKKSSKKGSKKGSKKLARTTSVVEEEEMFMVGGKKKSASKKGSKKSSKKALKKSSKKGSKKALMKGGSKKGSKKSSKKGSTKSSKKGGEELSRSMDGLMMDGGKRSKKGSKKDSKKGLKRMNADGSVKKKRVMNPAMKATLELNNVVLKKSGAERSDWFGLIKFINNFRKDAKNTLGDVENSKVNDKIMELFENYLNKHGKEKVATEIKKLAEEAMAARKNSRGKK
jgi:hypothetical protein